MYINFNVKRNIMVKVSNDLRVSKIHVNKVPCV